MNTQDSQTNKDTKNAIEYPILWEYLIFCTDKESLKSTIEAKFGGLEYSFADSKKTTNYSSHAFTINVISQNERDEIFKILREIECVKFVL